MREVTAADVEIHDDFWQPRLEMNAKEALPHQWMQLEQSGCIHNFRLVAMGADRVRCGWFFSDSDAYKWLDAACRVYATRPSPILLEQIESFGALLAAAQTEDGYLFTYNQLNFPGQRWQNLQIEHELYCHGHFIEAAIAHYDAVGQHHLLALARRAADLLVREFLDAGPERTPGHPEIEIALVKLFRTTGHQPYLALAQHFLEQRGRIPWFPLHILRQNSSVGRRSTWVGQRQQQFRAEHPGQIAFAVPPGNVARRPALSRLRFYLSALSGKYFQQHRPVLEQTVPVGHAVRFAYLQTALAMVSRALDGRNALAILEQAWQHMVSRRMYVTGGIGSLPGIEGFGRDYELDPELAYAETCAALGCMFWNWEMSLITRRSSYADLFEWQLYNAASVGMGLDGRSYLYNNPLASRGGVVRRGWYAVPCCPSNLSRTWADLGRYIYSHDEDQLWVHQYVGSEAELDMGRDVRLTMTSKLPWYGTAAIRFGAGSPFPLTLHLRIPSWADGFRLRVGGEEWLRSRPTGEEPDPPTASGYDPWRSSYVSVQRIWAPGDSVELELAMPVRVRRSHRRVRASRGSAALTRGPLVYCLESVDNPEVELFRSQLDLGTLCIEHRPALLGGIWTIRGRTQDGQELTAIPYAAWANRGESQMTVMVRT